MNEKAAKTQNPRERIVGALTVARDRIEADMPITLEALTAKGQVFLEEAKGAAVRSKPTYDTALELEKDIKGVQDKIREAFKEPKALGNEIHKFFTKAEKDALSPLVAAERMIKDKRIKWYQAEQRRAEERARKEAERRLREALERQAKEAERLREEGQDEAAAEVESEEPEVQAVKVTNRAVGGGAGFVKQWYAVVEDFDKIPRDYLVPDMHRLNDLARANAGQNPPPGVEFRYKTIARTFRK